METIEKKPLITFALFAYNQEQYIEEAVLGAFSQTYSPLEIVLSDDCSPDNTFAILEKMAKEYKGPHKIILNRNKKNLGIVLHVNKVCMNMAQGLFIVMAAGDDISLSNRVSDNILDWNNADRIPLAIQSASSLINEEGICVKEYDFIFPYEGLTLKEKSFESYINVKSFGAVAMYHRKLFEFFGPLTVAQVEDNPLIRRASLLGKHLYSKKPLVKVRTTESMSRISNRRLYLLVSSQRHESSYKQFLIDMKVFEEKSKIKFKYNEFNNVNKKIQYEIKKMKVFQCLASSFFFKRLIAWIKCKEYLPFGLWIIWFEFVLPSPLSNVYIYFLGLFNPKHKFLYIPMVKY